MILDEWSQGNQPVDAQELDRSQLRYSELTPIL